MAPLSTLGYYVAVDLGLSIGAMSFCKRILGIKGGNAGSASIARMMRDEPLEALLLGAAVFPFFEELIFRAGPAIFLSAGKPHWVAGVICCAVFALLHGLEDKKGNFVLPLPQFLGGLVFWHVYRTYGFMSCVGVHGLANALAMTLGWIELGWKGER